MRKLLWLLLTVPLLLVLLYTALPYVARSLIEEWLSEQGFTSPEIQLDHPGWDRLEIPRLSLIQSGDERRIQLVAQDVTLMFDPRRLLLNREIREIRIPRMQVEIRAERSIEARIKTSPAASFDLNRVPPTLLFRYAPSRRLVIGEVGIDYRAPDQPVIQAKGNIDLTRDRLISRMQLDIEPRHQDALAPVYLDIDFAADQRLELTLQRANTPMAHITGNLVTGNRQWQLALTGELAPVPLQQWLQPLLPTSSLALSAGRIEAGINTRWPAQLPLDRARLLQALSAEIDADLSLQSSGFALEQIEAKGIDLQLAAKASVAQSELQLSILPGGRLGAADLKTASAQLHNLQVQLEHPIELTRHLNDSATLAIKPIRLQIAQEGIDLQGEGRLSLSPLAATLEIQPDPLSAGFTLGAEQVSLTTAGKHLPEAALELDGRWQPDGARGSLRLNSQAPRIALSADWRLGDKDFRADWRIQPLNLPALQPLLQRWIEQRPADLTLGSGELRLNGRLAGPSPADATLTADIALRSADLSGGGTELNGLDADLRVRRTAKADLSSSGVLHTDLIRTGIDISDTRLAYDFRQAPAGDTRLALEPFSLNLLGGRIELPALEFDPTSPEFETTARLEEIQLSEALRLYQQPGLTGETALSGTLPLKIDGSRIEVNGGRIDSDTPGWIRYQPSPELEITAQSNPGLQLALSALSNLQLEQLNLRVNYAPNGDLELNSRLRGQNPDWQQGRPIDLTLNIEENLLQLLRSLQMSQRIGESLQKQLTR